MALKCPGQDSRDWKSEDVLEVECAKCGKSVELLGADATRRCPECGNKVSNPRFNLGCADWCAMAKECLGFDPKSLALEIDRQVSVVERVINAVKREFVDDRKRIEHAFAVLENAEEIMRQSTEHCDPRVVVSAALLHDIGIQEAERKHGSSAGKYQEIEGPPIARRILERLKFDDASIEHVCRIVSSHHTGRDIDTTEFNIVWDADRLVNFQEEHPDCRGDKLEEIIEKVFRTQSGKNRARGILIDRKD
jgi:HD superfamily phosphodiesterase